MLVLLTPLALYERVNNLPNPFWGLLNGGYTYTPQQGPPGPGLLDSRPEDALLAYLHDYIGVAGTYPCVQNLAQWQATGSSYADPMPEGQHCAVQRAVLSAIATLVVIEGPSFEHEPGAQVTFRIRYSDGEALSATAYFTARNGQHYLQAAVHLDCWENVDMLFFYPNVVAHAPPHVAYSPIGSSALTCTS